MCSQSNHSKSMSVRNDLSIPHPRQHKPQLYPHLYEQQDEIKSRYHQDKPDHPSQIPPHHLETAEIVVYVSNNLHMSYLRIGNPVTLLLWKAV